jgi:endonuclease/exonuclease/phosphatase family metal-dependent hydrolase
VIEGHDPRKLDIGLLSRFPIVSMKSNRHVKGKSHSFLFPRDCLEVEIQIGLEKNVYLYINHFTSLSDGREKSHLKRKAQSDKVASLVDSRWSKNDYKGNFIVLGDLNDYDDEFSSLLSLLQHPALENVVDRLPEEDKWTHYYKKYQEYHQLDYILISQDLSTKNPTEKPVIFRKGQPFRATEYKGFRYQGIGEDRPKASDHCPVYIDLLL